ncbi:MAG TPA: HDOD domain-containing protein [Candidatus Hydrogenedentes bacterium]|nr:HDOD domain-containing protein [Candidatus Hydrogenedentota bacterium]
MLMFTCDVCGHQSEMGANDFGDAVRCGGCGRETIATKQNTAGARTGGRAGGASRPVPQAPEGRRRIGELLCEAGLITRGQLNDALERQRRDGGKLGEVLISLGYLSPEAFLRFLSKQPGVASIDLANYAIPAELVALVPKAFAAKHEVFPIDKLGNLLTLGMACPLDAKTIAELEEMTGLRVKALLCSPDDIGHAINRYYPREQTSPATDGPVGPGTTDLGSRSVLRLRGVARLIRGIESLPALPDTVTSVRAAMVDMHTSSRDVAKIVSTDPPVAAKVLGVANSAAYGFRHRVDSIELAVSLLGLREVYSVVLSVAVIDLFDTTKKFDYNRFWRKALSCATASRAIATACGRNHQSGMFAAGLLHDVGRLALLETVPNQYAKIRQDLEGDELIKAEQDLIGLTHAEAGNELAEHWDLPKSIAEAIRFHHAPDQAAAHGDIVGIVAVADALTCVAPSSEQEETDLIARCASMLEGLGLTPQSADAEQMLDGVLALVRQSPELF